MVRIVAMGFTRSKSILLIALASFLQQSEAVSSIVTPLPNQNPPCAPEPDVTAFDINQGQIRVCFDNTLQGAIWTYHTVNGKALKQKTSGDGGYSGSWKIAGLSKDAFVLQQTQRQFYSEIYKKITNGKDRQEFTFFLARGHLTPNADFATKPERDATFHFINAAPQWQYFNGGSDHGQGHWLQLENDIRTYAEKFQDKTLHVITGTDGVLNVNNVDWYLTWQSTNANNQQKIPVPNFFWKIVWDDDKKQGAAFVGSNQDILNVVHQKAGNQGFPADQCPGTYGDVNKGIIWCYKIKDIFTVIPKLQNYIKAVPLPQGVTITKNPPFLNF